jgi:NADPH2:quinone reductase
MRAIGVRVFGGPEALEVLELPDPHAGAGEVRIEVHAAAVNPTDTVLRAGLRGRRGDVELPPPPYVPGMDAAGVLDEIGEGVESDLVLGEHVMAVVLPRGTRGAYAEKVVVPAESVVRVPQGASDVEAATLPMNGLTARRALDLLGLRPGEVLGVTGAAGAVGGYVIQLAKSEGLRVVADASASDDVLVASLGADVVVERGDDVATRMRAAFPGGVDALVDAALLHDKIVPAVRDNGRIASVRPFQGSTERGIESVLVLVSDYARQRAKLDELRRLVEAGVLSLRVARTFPAEEAPAAHRLLEAGGTRGRIVLVW